MSKLETWVIGKFTMGLFGVVGAVFLLFYADNLSIKLISGLAGIAAAVFVYLEATEKIDANQRRDKVRDDIKDDTTELKNGQSNLIRIIGDIKNLLIEIFNKLSKNQISQSWDELFNLLNNDQISYIEFLNKLNQFENSHDLIKNTLNLIPAIYDSWVNPDFMRKYRELLKVSKNRDIEFFNQSLIKKLKGENLHDFLKVKCNVLSELENKFSISETDKTILLEKAIDYIKNESKNHWLSYDEEDRGSLLVDFLLKKLADKDFDKLALVFYDFYREKIIQNGRRRSFNQRYKHIVAYKIFRKLRENTKQPLFHIVLPIIKTDLAKSKEQLIKLGRFDKKDKEHIINTILGEHIKIFNDEIDEINECKQILETAFDDL